MRVSVLFQLKIVESIVDRKDKASVLSRPITALGSSTGLLRQDNIVDITVDYLYKTVKIDFYYYSELLVLSFLLLLYNENFSMRLASILSRATSIRAIKTAAVPPA